MNNETDTSAVVTDDTQAPADGTNPAGAEVDTDARELAAIDSILNGGDGKTSAVQEEQQPAKPAFSPELLKRAEAAGYSREDVEAFGDPKHAEHALTVYERNAAKNKPAAPKTDETVAKPPEAQSDDEFKFDEHFKAEDLDEHYIKASRQLHDFHNKRYGGLQKQLADRLGRLEEADQVRRAEHVSSQFNTVMDELSEYESVLGGKDARNAEKRDAIITYVADLVQSHQARGEKLLKPDEYVKQAARALYGEELVKGEGQRIAKTLQKANAGFVPRPPHKAAPREEDPDEAELKLISKYTGVPA